MILTPELQRIRVQWDMFVSTQHCAAWKAGNPLRTHKKRYKIDRAVKDIVWRECDHKCARCRSPQYLTIEHIIPVVLGGSNKRSNLTLYCQACQRWSWARFRDVLKAVDAEAAA